jgi:competence protein ComEC
MEILSKIILYLGSAFILGISLGFLKKEQGTWFLLFFVFGLFLIFGYIFIKEFYFKKEIKLKFLIIFLFLIILFIIGGWLRYNSIADFEPTQTDLSYFNDIHQEIEIIGIVNRVEQRIKNNRAIVEVEKIKIEEEKKEVKGKVMIFISKLIEINYGDRIKIEGKLKTPEPFNRGNEDKSSFSRFASAHVFNWPKHLANEGIRSVMFRPWVTVLEENQGTFVMSKIYSLNLFLQQKINHFLPYPESAILSALLLGNQGEIPDEILENFQKTGIFHILSISGLHITIISVIFFWIILALGLWRKHAFILTSLFLIFYILMIGAPPYAVRAGIMGFLFLLAQYLGRAYSFQNAIIIAAAAILVFNPLSLFYDISFQFSFISILAIFLLFPLFQSYFYEKFHFKREERPIMAFFIDSFLVSGAVLLFLGPLIAYYFGNFPAISLLANFLTIILLSPILFFGIVFLLVSVIFPILTFLFGGIIYFLFFLLIYSNNFFANIPFIEILQFHIQFYLLIIYYIILLVVIFKIRKNKENIIPFISL